MSDAVMLRINPGLRNLIPPLSADERAGLEESILKEGVRDPVVVWDDTIVDGHNRFEIASGQNKNGKVLPFDTVEREFVNRAAAEVWILENQLSRRNLTARTRIKVAERLREELERPRGRPSAEEEKAQPVAPLSESKDERSTDAKVGALANVSRETVRRNKRVDEFGDKRLLDALDANDMDITNAYHLSLVGGKFPDTYDGLWELDGEEAKMRYSTPQLKHLLKMPDDETASDLVELVEAGNAKSFVDAHEFRQAEREKAARRQRNEDAARKREERKADLEAAGFYVPDLRNTDFRQSAVTEKVDAIITDPPYKRKFLGLYGDLGKFAAEHLADGGVLLAMAGQSYLPDVYRMLSEHLTYVWTIGYIGGGPNVTVYPRKVQSGWKPVLLYVKGPKYDKRSYVDYVNSAAADKKFHEWGQSESGFAALLENFTEPGDLVCDPFLGGGTTGVVAYGMKRRFIGMEVETDAYDKAAERLAA